MSTATDPRLEHDQKVLERHVTQSLAVHVCWWAKLTPDLAVVYERKARGIRLRVGDLAVVLTRDEARLVADALLEALDWADPRKDRPPSPAAVEVAPDDPQGGTG